VIVGQPVVRPQRSLPPHDRCERVCIARDHFPQNGTPHLELNRAIVGAGDCGCICRGRRQKRAQWDWLVDNTSAATTVQNADGSRATSQLRWLCEYNSCQPPHRCVSSTVHATFDLRACYALCMVVGTLEVWNENLTPVMLVMTNGPLWPPT